MRPIAGERRMALHYAACDVMRDETRDAWLRHAVRCAACGAQCGTRCACVVEKKSSA